MYFMYHNGLWIIPAFCMYFWTFLCITCSSLWSCCGSPPTCILHVLPDVPLYHLLLVVILLWFHHLPAFFMYFWTFLCSTCSLLWSCCGSTTFLHASCTSGRSSVALALCCDLAVFPPPTCILHVLLDVPLYHLFLVVILLCFHHQEYVLVTHHPE